MFCILFHVLYRDGHPSFLLNEQYFYEKGVVKKKTNDECTTNFKNDFIFLNERYFLPNLKKNNIFLLEEQLFRTIF